MTRRPAPRTTRTLAAALLAGAAASSAAAQGQPADRGTGDLGPNSASQRVVDPGIAQFSPEAALTDRFAGQSQARLIDLYHRPDVERRFVYRAPGLTALYNQSSYLTQDATGVIGINGTNGGNGRAIPITSADVIYVLSPDLIGPAETLALPLRPGQVDRRVMPTPASGPPTAHGYASPAGQGAPGLLNTHLQGQPNAPHLLDIEAIHHQYRVAPHDPQRAERARRWRAEREAAYEDEPDADAQANPAQDAPDEPERIDAAADNPHTFPVYGVSMPELPSWTFVTDRPLQREIAEWRMFDDEGEQQAMFVVSIYPSTETDLSRIAMGYARNFGLRVEPTELAIDGAPAVVLSSANDTNRMLSKAWMCLHDGVLYVFHASALRGSAVLDQVDPFMAGVRWLPMAEPGEHLALGEDPVLLFDDRLQLRLPAACRADRNPANDVERYYFIEVPDAGRFKEHLAMSVALADLPAIGTAEEQAANYFNMMGLRFSQVMGRDVELTYRGVPGALDTWTSDFVVANPDPRQRPEFERRVRYVLAVPQEGTLLLLQFMVHPDDRDHQANYDRMIDEVVDSIDYHLPDPDGE